MGRPSELKVDVELELHSFTSPHDEVTFYNIFSHFLILALMSLQVDKENEKDQEESGEDETKV